MMVKFESFWSSNPDWIDVDDKHGIRLREDAPPEAWESYRIYLKEVEEFHQRRQRYAERSYLENRLKLFFTHYPELFLEYESVKVTVATGWYFHGHEIGREELVGKIIKIDLDDEPDPLDITILLEQKDDRSVTTTKIELGDIISMEPIPIKGKMVEDLDSGNPFFHSEKYRLEYPKLLDEFFSNYLDLVFFYHGKELLLSRTRNEDDKLVYALFPWLGPAQNWEERKAMVLYSGFDPKDVIIDDRSIYDLADEIIILCME